MIDERAIISVLSFNYHLSAMIYSEKFKHGPSSE